MLEKSIAILFLVAVALVPVAIVALWHGIGAIWVTGYVVGIITVPLVAIVAMRAMSALFEDTQAFVAVTLYGVGVIAISFAAAIYVFVQ
jgi:thiamine transporter ThiT